MYKVQDIIVLKSGKYVEIEFLADLEPSTVFVNFADSELNTKDLKELEQEIESRHAQKVFTIKV